MGVWLVGPSRWPPLLARSRKTVLPLPSVLNRLRTLGIRSLMIEGGARLIHSCLQASSLIDALILTVAPTFVGPTGLTYASSGVSNISHDFLELELLDNFLHADTPFETSFYPSHWKRRRHHIQNRKCRSIVSSRIYMYMYEAKKEE